jgi:NhaP-type Na+/H+ or K+/H+ antiporter
MKMSHRLRQHQAGPIWGLVFGLLFTGIGIGLWCYAQFGRAAGPFDESFAVGALVVGLFSAIYSGRELHHMRQ